MLAKTGEIPSEKAEVRKEERIETEEEELARKLAAPAKKTGLGKLTRHSDGSFDFDWK
jgi:hypothetical protein